MKKYLVGGAVRDTLLKLPINEKDWVVIGSSPQEMIQIGYEQIGKDFPVFLHPYSREEYALARTERKSGHGYTGFICNTAPSITIEEDLYRRDLTINAMAYDLHGNLLDPYNGQKDIKLRLLRHVSHAFYEDPLRVLRVARFAARFNNIGFTIAPETLTLMTSMAQELTTLSPERIWLETKKALNTDNPEIYFQVLRQCGALSVLFPEIDILFSKFNFKTHDKYNHIYQNLGEYAMKTLSIIAHLSKNIPIRFAILCCNLLKQNQSTKTDTLKQSKSSIIDQLCNRLKIPHTIYKLSKIAAKYNNYLYDINKLSPNTIINIFDAFNCWKLPKQIEQILLINKVNLLIHNCNQNQLDLQKQNLLTAFQITNQINIQNIIADGFINSGISQELYHRRLNVLSIWKKSTT